MPNNGKALTNVAFRKKILEVIDKLKDQNATTLVRHVDDFEGLNKDTFEAGMNALVEAIPTGGGGGGGGGGDAGYTIHVTLEVDGDLKFKSCDKSISDIASHINEGINAYFTIEMPTSETESVTIYVSADNVTVFTDGSFGAVKMIFDISAFYGQMTQTDIAPFSMYITLNGTYTGEVDSWDMTMGGSEPEPTSPDYRSVPCTLFITTDGTNRVLFNNTGNVFILWNDVKKFAKAVNSDMFWYESDVPFITPFIKVNFGPFFPPSNYQTEDTRLFRLDRFAADWDSQSVNGLIVFSNDYFDTANNAMMHEELHFDYSNNIGKIVYKSASFQSTISSIDLTSYT